MATLIPLECAGIAANAAYMQVRHKQAELARISTFRTGELIWFADRPQTKVVATECTDPFFHKSRDMEIYGDALIMNQCRLALAPVLERQHGSLHICEDISHALSWFRANIAGHIRNYFVRVDEYPREPDETRMRENLRLMGASDEAFMDKLELYLRSYYTRVSVTGKLSACLFDPVMLFGEYRKEDLRVSNRVYRLSRTPRKGYKDIRKNWIPVGNYLVHCYEGPEPRHLQIMIDEPHLTTMRFRVRRVLNSFRRSDEKFNALRRLVGKFAESTKYARTGYEQAVEFGRYLQELAGEKLPQVEGVELLKTNVLYQFAQKQQYRMAFRHKFNFFYDPGKYDLSQFKAFFSPYREEG
ncbi:hypothetical protein [Geomonas oryzae]|uniref:hypothetical protein n=1 Tax=Geomonas oryzae TaxID=2364273 RepID=UPI00100AE72F|nr:hypothetical protein [Geomonas oryzae]